MYIVLYKWHRVYKQNNNDGAVSMCLVVEQTSAAELRICRVSSAAAPVTGGTQEIFLLCEKVTKGELTFLVLAIEYTTTVVM